MPPVREKDAFQSCEEEDGRALDLKSIFTLLKIYSTTFRQVLPGGVGNTTMVVRAGDLRGIVLACAVLFMAGCSLLAYHEGIAAISGEPSQFSYLERWIAQRSAAHPEISRLGRCTSTSRTFEPQAKYP